MVALPLPVLVEVEVGAVVVVEAETGQVVVSFGEVSKFSSSQTRVILHEVIVSVVTGCGRYGQLVIVGGQSEIVAWIVLELHFDKVSIISMARERGGAVSEVCLLRK